MRPVPSDDQYLPSFCDVVQLLWELVRAEEGEELAGVAKTVAEAVLDAELAGGRGEAESVKETLEKLRELVAGGGGGGGDGEGTENGQVAGEKEKEKEEEEEEEEEGGQEEGKESVAVNEDESGAKEGSVEG